MLNYAFRPFIIFLLSTFFFSHSTSQHNIHSKQIKHNKTTDVYSLFQKSNQKGESRPFIIHLFLHYSLVWLFIITIHLILYLFQFVFVPHPSVIK